MRSERLESTGGAETVRAASASTSASTSARKALTYRPRPRRVPGRVDPRLAHGADERRRRRLDIELGGELAPIPRFDREPEKAVAVEADARAGRGAPSGFVS